MAIQDFVAAQTLTATQMDNLQANDYNWTVTVKTASYVLVAADKGTRIAQNVGTANTVTVNTSLFAAGDIVAIHNIGAGAVTVTAGTATVTSAGSLVVNQWGGGHLYFTSASAAIWFPSAASGSGLTLVGSADPSAVASVSIDNCFSATYQNYLVTYDLVQSTGATLKVRLRVASVDAATNYNTSYIYQLLSGAGTGQVTTGAATEAYIMQSAGSLTTLGQMFVHKPFIAIATGVTMQHLGESTPPGYFFSGGWNHTTATSYDGLTIFPNSGTMTGTIRVYGLALT